MASVMPKPPAAFSPLMTTKSSDHRAIRPGRRSCTAVRPLRPRMSPMKRMRTRSDPEVDDLAFGEDEIEARVAQRGRNGRGLLSRERQPDRDDRFDAAQPGDRHVIIAGPIAD